MTAMTTRKATLDEAFDIENLRRAWRWLRSNPDARFKGYFRDLYSAYAVIDEWYLMDLSDRLKRGVYEPSHACRIHLPKSSGILRPFTLLTIEDQIVYQAMINIVAEKLVPHVSSKYYVETFGHVYAGKNSIWFYRKWSNSYKKFNDAARSAVKSGLKFSASFDLTACYDSLDHEVLAHFLQRMDCDKEFCEFLKRMLGHWTATNNGSRIYMHHGIPQGPLSSGLLSEVVLHYFDLKHRSQKNMRYLRYVDDIRLFAGSRAELRKALVKLDLISKDVGLFPQSSKIEIHEVKDIESELKSISNPIESVVSSEKTDQGKLLNRLIALSPNFIISNPTRFKYLLAHAAPSSKLSQRLWRIYENDPSFYEAMLRYFKKYTKFSDSVTTRFLSEIKTPQIYDAIVAAMIDAIEDRIPAERVKPFNRAIRAMWKWRPNILPFELQYSVGRWVIKFDLLKSTVQRVRALNLKSWFAKLSTTRALDNSTLALPVQTRILNGQLESTDDDVAVAAAFLIVKRSLPVLLSPQIINRVALAFLKEMGLVAKSPIDPCGIEKSMTRLLGASMRGVNWKAVFAVNYAQAERVAISCRAYAQTNVTSWVNTMDTFNDLVLNELFLHDGTLGQYQLGNIGAYLQSSTTRFAQKYPKMFRMASEIHSKRLESHLSHPFVRKSGQPTGPIKYSYLRHGLKISEAGFTEMLSKW